MENPDYQYIFEDIESQATSVCRIDLAADEEHHPVLLLKDDPLNLNCGRRLPSVIADLIDIASAVYVADRWSPHSKQKSEILLSVPVRNAGLFNSEGVQGQLKDTLYWFTGNDWTFDFTKRNKAGRRSEIQDPLPLPGFSNPQQIEVALWSGGLDSLAGLYGRIKSGPDRRFALFGAGGNPHIYAVQRRVAEALKEQFPYRVSLTQLFIESKGTDEFSKNRAPRARGFVFLLQGAAFALLQQQNSLHVYENGTGAINLPFSHAATGTDHTRAVHPESLLRVGEVVSNLIGAKFSIDNPFAFSTKAQMCAALKANSNLICDTVTCDSRHRQKGLPMQCGYCSSCLLRRQALAAAGIVDPTDYVATSPNRTNPPDPAHLTATLHQVERLRRILSSSTPWEGMVDEYQSIWIAVDAMAKLRKQPQDEIVAQFLGLYGHYVEEWDNETVRNTIVKPISLCQSSCGATNHEKEQAQWMQISLM